MNHRYDEDDFRRRERHDEQEYSPPYGQREPYSSRSDYGRERSRDWARPDESRYSESQYGQAQRDRSQEWHEGDQGRSFDNDRASGGNWPYGNRGEQWRSRNAGGRGYAGDTRSSGHGSTDYGSERGYGRGDRYGTEQRYGRDRDIRDSRYRNDDFDAPQRFGVGYSGSQAQGHVRSLADRPFDTGEQPRYYGTGYYGEGRGAFSGGMGDERWGGNPSSFGRLRSEEQESRFYGGGYDEPHEERPGLLRRLFGKGPKGYQRSDERLREDISERLMHAGEIDSSEVSVSVVSGKVVLEGSVPERYMKHAIEDMVDACPGVQDIDNRVRVDRRAGAYSSSGYASSTGAGSASASGTSHEAGDAGVTAGSGYGAGGPSTTTGTSAAGRSARKDS
jgi:hypothetical protein